jgi:hypothetical protein
VATLTRAALGKLEKRPTREIKIGEDTAIIRRPSPLEYGRYQKAMYDPKAKGGSIDQYADANMRLVAMMWVDDKGERLFSDDEYKQLDDVDNAIYHPLADACQSFAKSNEEEKAAMGESDSTTDSDSPAGSASSSESTTQRRG